MMLLREAVGVLSDVGTVCPWGVSYTEAKPSGVNSFKLSLPFLLGTNRLIAIDETGDSE